MTGIDAQALERFLVVLRGRFGLTFEDSRLASVAEVLRRRGEATPGGLEAFLTRIEAATLWRDELRTLVSELTVPETYFFRNNDQFRALVGTALPERVSARPAGARLRLLSAGCATGEEPYTLAILLRSELPGREATIRAIDLNPKVLEKAKIAHYSKWALRETPDDVRERWFRRDGQGFVLDAGIRTMVTFEERNLAEDDRAFWQPGSFDVIFCRNVIMYMTIEAQRDVIARISRALAPGGFLFLGHAETLRGLSQDFHLRHTHETFYYQRRLESEPARDAEMPYSFAVPSAHGSPSAVLSTEPTVELAWADAWVETVRRTSARIAVLAATPPPTEAASTPDEKGPVAPTARADVLRARELLGEERFAEARTLMGSLSAESAHDADVLLLRAVLLTHGGDLGEAEKVSSELLAMDEMNAGAHYVMALCRESAGDAAGAAEHDQRAVYLDPTFAMPRLHLGLLARRAGDVLLARRELARALDLLEREEASRVLLFGGGFRREALVAACRAELIASGGAP